MQQYIVGNWKMNGTREQAHELATKLNNKVLNAPRPLAHIAICPPFVHLDVASQALKDSPINLGAQDCSTASQGAYTGDISPTQLTDIGCKYVLIGHSERRLHHHESSDIIQKKLTAAVLAGLKPILCVGENLETYENKLTIDVITKQLRTDIPKTLSADQFLIAYEPIWAIGTGFTPTLAEIEETMGMISHELSLLFTGGGIIPVLYGGSVKASNAEAILNLPHVNGLLVGGASLDSEEFVKIIMASIA